VLRRWQTWLVIGAAIAAVFFLTSPQQRAAWIARITGGGTTALVLARISSESADVNTARIIVSVKNEGTKTLSNISVSCRAFERLGAVIGTKTRRVEADKMPPGFHGEVTFDFPLEGRAYGRAECDATGY
jgi:hypothetical protein